MTEKTEGFFERRDRMTSEIEAMPISASDKGRLIGEREVYTEWAEPADSPVDLERFKLRSRLTEGMIVQRTVECGGRWRNGVYAFSVNLELLRRDERASIRAADLTKEMVEDKTQEMMQKMRHGMLVDLLAGMGCEQSTIDLIVGMIGGGS